MSLLHVTRLKVGHQHRITHYVSKIYLTEMGWAIAIKVDERYIDTDLENCKEQNTYLKAQNFYLNWLKDLRNAAYIEIYTDKL